MEITRLHSHILLETRALHNRLVWGSLYQRGGGGGGGRTERWPRSVSGGCRGRRASLVRLGYSYRGKSNHRIFKKLFPVLYSEYAQFPLRITLSEVLYTFLAPVFIHCE